MTYGHVNYDNAVLRLKKGKNIDHRIILVNATATSETPNYTKCAAFSVVFPCSPH